jgi:hypothetical protein
MRGPYPCDITRAQFSLIEYPLRSARKVTRPRTYGLYDIFCAVLYVPKEGRAIFRSGTSSTTITK